MLFCAVVALTDIGKETATSARAIAASWRDEAFLKPLLPRSLELLVGRTRVAWYIGAQGNALSHKMESL